MTGVRSLRARWVCDGGYESQSQGQVGVCRGLGVSDPGPGGCVTGVRSLRARWVCNGG